jgi:hypothetical protein
VEVAVLRLLHITAGVVWAAAAIVMGWFVIPAVREAGPAGGAVMRGIVARRLPQIAIVTGLLTVLAGLRLYQIRFSMGWLWTLEGLALTLALLVGLSALGMGIFVQRPTAVRLVALAATAAGAPPSDEMKRLSDRLGRIGNALAWHAVTMVVLMAGLRLFQALS